MAQIIRFPCKAPADSPGAIVQGASAQILFFTGVRYERAAKETKKKAPRRQRRRRPQRSTKSA